MEAKFLGVLGAAMLACSATAQADVLECGTWTGANFTADSYLYDKICNYEINFGSLNTPIGLTVIPQNVGLNPGDTVLFTTVDVGTLNNFSGFTANAVAVDVATVDSGSHAMVVGTPTSDRFTNIAVLSTTSLLFSGATLSGAGGIGGSANIDFSVMLPAAVPIASLTINHTLTNVPEPATLALLGLGLTGLALSRRKRS